jgi:hypothetical protein
LRHLFEQLAHALCVCAQLRRLRARFLREEEVEVDRLFSELTMFCVPGAIE